MIIANIKRHLTTLLILMLRNDITVHEYQICGYGSEYDACFDLYFHG
ncbi:MAG: hypothetical protein FD169_1732 [Bacillota bacterium]|nr:MAG: hypothetical protein FD169_1732 [Bacillota bacterium]